MANPPTLLVPESESNTSSRLKQGLAAAAAASVIAGVAYKGTQSEVVHPDENASGTTSSIFLTPPPVLSRKSGDPEQDKSDYVKALMGGGSLGQARINEFGVQKIIEAVLPEELHSTAALQKAKDDQLIALRDIASRRIINTKTIDDQCGLNAVLTDTHPEVDRKLTGEEFAKHRITENSGSFLATTRELRAIAGANEEKMLNEQLAVDIAHPVARDCSITVHPAVIQEWPKPDFRKRVTKPHASSYHTPAQGTPTIINNNICVTSGDNSGCNFTGKLEGAREAASAASAASVLAK